MDALPIAPTTPHPSRPAHLTSKPGGAHHAGGHRTAGVAGHHVTHAAAAGAGPPAATADHPTTTTDHATADGPRTTAHAPLDATTTKGRGGHAAPVPAGPEDFAILAQQAAFDRVVQQRAELQREANALRDLAMAQVKRDDQTMTSWIRLI